VNRRFPLNSVAFNATKISLKSVTNNDGHSIKSFDRVKLIILAYVNRIAHDKSVKVIRDSSEFLAYSVFITC
jgi:hypothetical protein